MSDPFSQYKLPLGLADAVDIHLPNTSAVFTVRLPGNMNEDFNMMLMSSMQTTVDEEGQIKVDAMKFQKARSDLFFSTCIIAVSGLPEGMSGDEFFKAYPLAKRWLYDRATELAEQADKEAQDALGKLNSMPSGKASGTESTNSTKRSSKAA